MLLMLTPAGADAGYVQLVKLPSPTPLDFSLDMITPPTPVKGMQLSILSPTTGLAVVVAVARSKPNIEPESPILRPHLDPHSDRIFVLLINSRPAASEQPVANSLTVQVRSESATTPWTVIENQNVLADGAPNPDCSMLHYFPGPPGAWGFANASVVLRAAFDISPFERWEAYEELAAAINVACGSVGGGEFPRRVRQEPPPPHP